MLKYILNLATYFKKPLDNRPINELFGFKIRGSVLWKPMLVFVSRCWTWPRRWRVGRAPSSWCRCPGWWWSAAPEDRDAWSRSATPSHKPSTASSRFSPLGSRTQAGRPGGRGGERVRHQGCYRGNRGNWRWRNAFVFFALERNGSCILGSFWDLSTLVNTAEPAFAQMSALVCC